VDDRLPDGVEVAAYYVVSEMLTNAAKHAQASVVHVDVARADERTVEPSEEVVVPPYSVRALQPPRR
jgi:glucose-6-phosphate-specific signal transduction histidine kinase